MFRHALLKLMIPAAVLLGTHSASAESRLALVIGQSAYRSVPALPNPANDAREVTKLLTDSGFEVSTAADLSQGQMREAVSDFAGKIAAKGADTVALVFYAGHGLQIDGENFLVPVDIDPKREADIPIQAVRLNDILNTLTSVPSKMRILMLDACRNNPFPDLKTAGGGLALVDAKIGAPGTFLSFSTSPGAVAEDGSGSNSPYTNALLAAGQRAEHSDRGNFQAGAACGEQGHRWPADPVGQLLADRGFPLFGRIGRRAEACRSSEEDGRRVDPRSEGQAGRGGERADRGRRHRRIV